MVFDGELLIYLDEGATKKPLAYNKTATLSVKLDTKDIVTKEDGEWSEKLAGRLGWSISGDGSYCLDSGTSNKSADMLFDKIVARTPVDIIYGIDGTTATYSGKAFLTTWELSSGAGEIPTYSTSLDGTGKLTKIPKPV
jgi:predicted secreted protein